MALPSTGKVLLSQFHRGRDRGAATAGSSAVRLFVQHENIWSRSAPIWAWHTAKQPFLPLVDVMKLSREKTYGGYRSTNEIIADVEDDFTWYKKDEIRYDRIPQQQK
jgi:hypothetical protein